MTRRMRAIVIAAVALVVLLGVLLAADRLDRSLRTRSAFRRNAPDILIADPHASTTFPDAMHVQLADGRRFRLAHVDARVGVSGIPPAPDAFWGIFHNGANVMAGLRSVGTSEDGEPLVEPWVLRGDPSGCGSATWLERRRGRIPQWRDMTWRLTDSGYYWLLPNAARQKPEAAAYQRMAIRDGQGLWRNPAFLRTHLDLRPFEAMLDRVNDHHTNAERGGAADLLVRTDPATYVPRLLALVTDPADKDPFFRAQLALMLERHGYPEGTRYWMEALRNGGAATGLDEYALNSVANEYGSAWNQQGRGVFHNAAAVLRHYEQMQRPAAAGQPAG